MAFKTKLKHNKVLYWKDIGMMTMFQHNDFENDTIFLPKSIKSKYKEVYVVNENISNNSIFHKLNSENNPLGTKHNQEYLVKNKVRHTSMSVGDIIQRNDGSNYVAMPVGFKKVVWIK